MGKPKAYRIFVGDFETTVYEGQESTEVWSSASVELNTEDVNIFHSIDEQFNYFTSLKSNIIVYYHNLKFDGAFWLDYLLIKKKFKPAIVRNSAKEYDVSWKKTKDMAGHEYKCSISDRGMWYSITFKHNDCIFELRDSLKLLPFSVRQIGESFQTKHKKLDMEYKGYRYAGCFISDDEKRYIANDVFVVKEALEFMFSEGHNKLTIGACCLSEYKMLCKTSTKNLLDYQEMFPDLQAYRLDESYGYGNAGDWIRKSYKGGWCYVKDTITGLPQDKGFTLDVNSLYPSMMHSESGNFYPIGHPVFWQGNFIPEIAKKDNHFYFVRVKTRFYLKKNKLPFVQIKDNLLYKSTEMLKSSDVYDYKKGLYYSHYIKDGEKHDTRVTLTLTMMDFELLQEHYDLVDFEIIDGCWFWTDIGIFDEYIDKYKKIKQEAKGAKRTLAKLYLNNLYGKMATSTDSSFKFPIIKPDGVIGFIPVSEHNKKAGYIAVGSAITSYARCFTIKAAQANYSRFLYADTDSIHCLGNPDEVIGVKIDPKAFCCWKCESEWDKSFFTRQKTYIEHIIKEDGKSVESFYNLKCAGMPERCKELFIEALEHKNTKDDKTPDEIDFLFDDNDKPKYKNLTDFKVGLKVPSKLRPKRIKGGVLLIETTYEMR